MILNNNEIGTYSFSTLFEQYNVTEEDIISYRALIDSGNENEALDNFLSKYVDGSIGVYENIISNFMIEMEKGEVPEETKRSVLRNIAVITAGMAILFNSNFSRYVNRSFSPVSFAEYGITNPKTKNAILDSTLSKFEAYTAQALANTQNYVLKNIREIQKEFVVFNRTLEGLSDAVIARRTSEFLSTLKNRVPEYDRLKSGKLVVTSTISPDQVARFYTLEHYVNMSIRTTILNIDRTAVQIYVLNKEAERAQNRNRVAVNVVEYAVVDNRTLKTNKRREICKSILANNKYGVPLLALDEDTAGILGLRTVNEVASTPDYAMGPFCTHGLRPISVSLRKKLEKILREGSNA